MGQLNSVDPEISWVLCCSFQVKSSIFARDFAAKVRNAWVFFHKKTVKSAAPFLFGWRDFVLDVSWRGLRTDGADVAGGNELGLDALFVGLRGGGSVVQGFALAAVAGAVG